MATALAVAHFGAVLQLTGPGSHVSFSNGARLYSDCGNTVSAKTGWISPTTIDMYLPGDAANLTVHLREVPTDCSDLQLGIPCAAPAEFVPPLFWCNYNGTGGSVALGPLNARAVIHEQGGVRMGYYTMLDCPFPVYSVTASPHACISPTPHDSLPGSSPPHDPIPRLPAMRAPLTSLYCCAGGGEHYRRIPWGTTG